MPLFTAGTIATAVGIVWQYWRVPIRLWEWRYAEEVEPAVGQIWREASLSGPNHDMKVIECDDRHILTRSTTDKDSFGDYLELDLTWEGWEMMVKARRLYCKFTNETIEDRYWGDHADE